MGPAHAEVFDWTQTLLGQFDSSVHWNKLEVNFHAWLTMSTTPLFQKESFRYRD
jgi:hypothetical protein